MSLVKKQIILSVVAGLFASAVFVAIDSANNESRKPASLTSSKPRIHFRSKLGAPFKMALSQISETPDSQTDEFQVQGFITLIDPPGPEIFYEWTLPEGTRIVAGELSDSFTGVKQGETIIVDLAVDNLDVSKNQIITLSAWYVDLSGNRKSFSSAISTRPELTYSGRLELKGAEELAVPDSTK